MKYEVICKAGEYALVQRLERMTEYAVVHWLDEEKGCWAATYSYWNFGEYSKMTQTEALMKAADCLMMLTNPDYIPYDRMTEIATKALDGLFEDEVEEACEYCEEVIELTKKEIEYFGLEYESDL